MNTFRNAHYRTLASTVALGLAASGFAFAADDNDTADDVRHAWEESKQDSESYWSEFRQDSEQTWENSQAAFRDGWVEGKLHTAITVNRHLNPFDIGVQVDDGVAVLEGTVSSDIDVELAEQIALGIEGVDEVDNRLRSDGSDDQRRDQQTAQNEVENEDQRSAADREQQLAENDGRGLSGYLEDATTTASIKTELLSSANVGGLSIDVDTENAGVVLSGEVESEEEKELAERIARNHVANVTNNLTVEPSS